MAARDVTPLRDHVFGLTYGEIAVAVMMAPGFDAGPYRAPAEMVRAGLAAAGRDEIVERAAWLRAVGNTKWLGETPALREHAAAMLAEWWRGEHRFNRAHLIAEQVWEDCGYGWPELAPVGTGRAA